MKIIYKKKHIIDIGKEDLPSEHIRKRIRNHGDVN
ncbi:unnamed protein product, partial [Rotaria sordida]